MIYTLTTTKIGPRVMKKTPREVCVVFWLMLLSAMGDYNALPFAKIILSLLKTKILLKANVLAKDLPKISLLITVFNSIGNVVAGLKIEFLSCRSWS